MNFSFQRIVSIARKEVRQLARDRLTFGMIIGIPTMQLLLFGYAINTDVRNMTAMVYDESNTSLSRQFVDRVAQTQVVKIVGTANSAAEIEKAFRQGRASLGIVIPYDFSQRVRHDNRPYAQLMVDGTDPQITAASAGLQTFVFDPSKSPDQPPMNEPVRPYRSSTSKTFETRVYFNAERITSISIVPALIAIILTMTMTLFTSLAIVREKERGNLELLIATPVTSFELMIGKILPYIVIGVIQLTLVLLVGRLVFAVPVRGSLAGLYVLAIGFIIANLSVGLVFSTIAQTQFQSMQLMLFFFLPSILLSGYMFPFEGMPRPAQWFGELLPATHFIRIVRGILVRGSSVLEISHELLPLLIFFCVMVFIASKRFTKKLD